MITTGQHSKDSGDLTGQTPRADSCASFPARAHRISPSPNIASPPCIPTIDSGPLVCQAKTHDSQLCAAPNQGLPAAILTSHLEPKSSEAGDTVGAKGQDTCPTAEPHPLQAASVPWVLPAPGTVTGALLAVAVAVAALGTGETERPPPQPASTAKFSRRNAPYVCQV